MTDDDDLGPEKINHADFSTRTLIKLTLLVKQVINHYSKSFFQPITTKLTLHTDTCLAIAPIIQTLAFAAKLLL